MSHRDRTVAAAALTRRVHGVTAASDAASSTSCSAPLIPLLRASTPPPRASFTANLHFKLHFKDDKVEFGVTICFKWSCQKKNVVKAETCRFESIACVAKDERNSIVLAQDFSSAWKMFSSPDKPTCTSHVLSTIYSFLGFVQHRLTTCKTKHAA